MIKQIIAISFVLATVWATPTTQIWNPATDIQAKGTFHLGIDNYFSTSGAFSSTTMFPVDLGLEYGLLDNLEVGLDLFYPNGAAPVALNAKYAIAESKDMPALAVGIMGVGLKANDAFTDMKMMYGLASKTMGAMGRFSAGYFTGNSAVLLDANSAVANTGVMLTYDKALTDKLWVAIDYASGKSALGATFIGFAYTFSPNTSVIVALGKLAYDDSVKLTTQLDINL